MSVIGDLGTPGNGVRETSPNLGDGVLIDTQSDLPHRADPGQIDDNCDCAPDPNGLVQM
jgi:hypothetical protein